MSWVDIVSACSTVIEDPHLWIERLPTRYAARAPRMIDGGRPVWVLDETSTAPGYAAEDVLQAAPAGQSGASLDKLRWLASGEGRLWLQGRDGTSGEVLYSTGGVWALINADPDAEFVLACYRAYNDWIAELSAHDPDSIIGLARIPVTGLDDAKAELVRAVESLHLRGAILDAWPDGFDGPPYGPDADPFWEAAASLGAPISIHQGLSGRAEAPPPVHHGGPPSFGFDLNAIVYGNVFDRYPALRIVAASPAVGWAPTAFEGLGESYMRTAGTRSIQLKDGLLPADYLRTFFHYVLQDDRFGILNRDYFGDAHLMWGSFALSPEDTVWPNTRQLFETRLAGQTDEVRRRLGAEVVCRLYGLRGAAPFAEAELSRFANYALL